MFLIGGLAAIVLVGIIVGAIIGFTSIGGGGSGCNDSDGFEKIEFDKGGQKQFLKIKFVQDDANSWYYTFEESDKACRQLGAELWDVQGELEWNAVIDAAKSNHKDEFEYGTWINGKVEEDCTGEF